MYAVSTLPLDNLTLQAFLKAEFGFFGLITIVLNTTAFFSGQFSSAGVLDLLTFTGCPLLFIFWFIDAYLAASLFGFIDDCEKIEPSFGCCLLNAEVAKVLPDNRDACAVQTALNGSLNMVF